MSGTIFISYSKDDLKWRKQIQKHLGVLEYSAGAEIWADDRIDEGDSWYEEIRSAIGRSAVGIMLLTPSFLGTGFIQKEEIPELIRRRVDVGMLLIPILVEDCAWDTQRWLNQKHIQMTPPKGAPLETLKGKEQTHLLARLTEKIDKHLHSWSSDRVEDGYSSDPGRQPLPTVPTTSARPVAETTQSADDIPKTVVDISHLPQTGLTLFGRDEQLNQLDEIWEQASHRVVSYVAAGGVGKSSLINKWMSEFAKDDYRGARRVYGWSFYSQGTRDQITSADAFLDQALRFFGDENPESGSPWDKGERLADLVSTERSLIVLDGMEPLQSGHDVDKGKLRDPGLQAFLTKLVQTESRSLCVVTTREKVTDLHDLKPVESLLTLVTRSESEEPDTDSAPTKPFLEVTLDKITPDAGRALLRHTRIVGTDEELESLAKEFGPHALTVLLLGAWLHQTPGHLASNAKDLPTEGDPLERVLTGFEEFLGEGPEHQVLRLLGLFDRPATAAELAAIAAGDRIPGVTEYLVPLENVEKIEANSEDGHWGPWQPWLSKLRDLHLIGKHCHSRPDEFDAHPLIREYFAKCMKEEHHPSSVREAHGRLYEHLKQSAPERPDNLNDMMPLYHAVAHGCKAGLENEAVKDVYLDRIQQGAIINFAMHKLGVVGLDLAAVGCFFRRAWTVPTKHLKAPYDAAVLSWAGFRLRSLGRLFEAVEPTEQTLQMQIGMGMIHGGSEVASTLSELSLTLGNVSVAVRHGERSVELADRSGHSGKEMLSRTALAAILFYAGPRRFNWHEEQDVRSPPHLSTPAHAAFHEAEEMHAQLQPTYPLLYSLQGYQYCELLLADISLQISRWNLSFTRRRPKEDIDENSSAFTIRSGPSGSTNSYRDQINFTRGLSDLQSQVCSLRSRAETTLEWFDVAFSGGILDQGLNYLTLGRTWKLSARIAWIENIHSSPNFSPAAESRHPTSESAAIQQTGPGAFEFQQAENNLTESLTLLRRSGEQEFIAVGLLQRAALWREMLAVGIDPPKQLPKEFTVNDPKDSGHTYYLTRAERDLSEAESISDHSSMLIWQIEAALERTNLLLTIHGTYPFTETQASQCLKMAQEKLDETRQLVLRTDKPYEPHVPDWDEWEPPEYVGVFEPGEMVGYHCRDWEIDLLQEQIDSLRNAE